MYEALFAQSVARLVSGIVRLLRQNGVYPGARVVDAGCGPGVHAAGLARHGYRVIGVDRSAELIEIAQRRALKGQEFVHCDLRGIELSEPVDAVLCRGVLNDALDGRERDQILRRFRGVLSSSGVLALDVRDWERSRTRYQISSLGSRRGTLDRKAVMLQTETHLDIDRQLLLIDETIFVEELEVSRNKFVMRCWTADELRKRLERAGFRLILLHDSYPGARFPSDDRIIATASVRSSPQRQP